MIKSMTGYGVTSFENDALSIQIEIKTLNSKFLDVTTKFPKEFAHLENELKKIVSEKLQRGKINFTIELILKSTDKSAGKINQVLFEHYRKELETASRGLKLSDSDIFNGVLKMPDILETNTEPDELLTKQELSKLVIQATDQCNAFRIQEGNAVEMEMQRFANNIADRLTSIKELDPARIDQIKTRIHGNLEEIIGTDQIDANRFEQEIIYYIEKLDISEELIRLDNHIKYFLETLSVRESQGKKLGFISQEMGREINTIGSKANDAQMQKLVVDMKDDLEKIKEQVLNIV